jgi:hypothetical protein
VKGTGGLGVLIALPVEALEGKGEGNRVEGKGKSGRVIWLSSALLQL